MSIKRIAVVGVSASGKSLFARKLGAQTKLPLTHVDSIMWNPGWEYIGDEKTAQKLLEISSQEEWIIEGFIEKDSFDPVLGRAEHIIFLNYPRYVPVWRYIKRWLKHRKDPRPELPGSPDSFSFEFLMRIWNQKEVYWLNKFLDKIPDKEKVVYLKTPKQAEEYLSSN